MSNVVVRADGLGKRYRLQPQQATYATLRESLARAAAHVVRTTAGVILGRRRGVRGQPSGDFWALHDVSFEVRSGEIVGLIGANGSGKSTLLKLLARITAPTTGRAEVQGRVGSLLEVGTGFHPELTGRENIFLNGAILGMPRGDIRRNFDAIVTFAGVETFIDMPLKRYSTGMYLRLAFAVAAHLEADILLVDEVLAVGDAAFQKQCLGKMKDVASSGRTVLFVSHNMVAVQSLCSRAIWLRAGRVHQIGNVAPLVSEYLRESTVAEGERIWPDPSSAPGNEWIRLHRARVRPCGDTATALTVRTRFAIEIEYWNLRAASGLALSVHLYNDTGVLIFCVGPPHEEVFGGRPLPVGLFCDRCEVPGDLLNDGVYRAELYVMRNSAVVYHNGELLSFTVSDSTHRRGAWFGKWPGAVRPNVEWTTELLETPPPRAKR